MSDPHKNKTLRISYYSKVTKKPKFKQVKVKNFESEEKAKEFLDKWKVEQIEKETKFLAEKPKIDHNDLEEQLDKAEKEIKQELMPYANDGDEQPSGELPTVQKTKFKLDLPDSKTDGMGATTVIFASAKAGKTTLTTHIIKKYYDDKNTIVIVMSPSINATIYKGIKKMKNVIAVDFFDSDLIRDLAKIQRKTSNKYRFCVVLDDVVDGKNNQQIQKMILVYRNLSISTVLNLQDIKLMSRTGRHNGNNFLFMRQNTQDAIEDVLNLYLNSYPPFTQIPNKMDKVNMYRKLTEDRGIIYLNALDDEISFHNKI
jgi:hypothetical protein